jgi:hypothetical protein
MITMLTKKKKLLSVAMGGSKDANYTGGTTIRFLLGLIMEQVRPNCGKECAACCHSHCVGLHTPSTGSVIHFTVSCPNAMMDSSRLIRLFP